jgi:hypothetical protein
MVDAHGEVRGVIQLLNKKEGEISDQDTHEFKCLLPTLGEILRTADEAFEIQKL